MPTFVGFGKLERELLSNSLLPADLRVSIIEFKNDLKAGFNLRTGGRLDVFENREGHLPPAAAGQTYYKYQVGQAHAGDDEPRGSRRLVALVDPVRTILKLFFTDAHYTFGQWKQLQYP